MNSTWILLELTMSKTVKAVVWGTAIIGTGYGLMRFTVPNDAQMREVQSRPKTFFFFLFYSGLPLCYF